MARQLMISECHSEWKTVFLSKTLYPRTELSQWPPVKIIFPSGEIATWFLDSLRTLIFCAELIFEWLEHYAKKEKQRIRKSCKYLRKFEPTIRMKTRSNLKSVRSELATLCDWKAIISSCQVSNWTLHSRTLQIYDRAIWCAISQIELADINVYCQVIRKSFW